MSIPILSPIPLTASELSRCRMCIHPYLSEPGRGGQQNFPLPSLSCLKHCRKDGWGAEASACDSVGREGRLLCLQGDCVALAEGKEKDQPASKVEAKLFALHKGLVKGADSQLDREVVSNKQC